MGLLMNHLGVDEYIRVVFDAGDSKLEGLDDETPDAESIPVDLAEIRGERSQANQPASSLIFHISAQTSSSHLLMISSPT